MKQAYVIPPILLMCGFLLVYRQHVTHAEIHEKEVARVAAVQKADAEAKKLAAIELARSDAAKRAEARVAEEKQKEAEKRAKWDATGQRISDEIAANEKLISSNGAAVKALEAELAAARTTKKSLTEKFFSLAREAELDRIAKRNAELEIQRLTEIVARQHGTTVAASP